MKLSRFTFIIILLFCGSTRPALAMLEFPLPPPPQNMVGETQWIESKRGDNFDTISSRYHVGFYELIEANPDVKPYGIKPGTEILIPSSYILPDAAPHEGIVVNMAEMRLYYYPPGQNKVYTMPVGVGRYGWLPPLGLSKIVKKETNPTWHVPKAVKEYVLKDRGIELPNEVPPGPENPLGKHVFWLSLRGFLIHGTNDPHGVGKRSSSGCIRMYPEDIAKLYEMVPLHTPVYFISQSSKVGLNRYQQLFLEVHQPLQEELQATGANDLTDIFQILLTYQQQSYRINWALVKKMIENQSGLALQVGEFAAENG